MSWEPTEGDLAWCRQHLTTVRDGGYWGTTNGVYRVEHEAKRLAQISRAPGYQPHLHERNVIAFGKIGYTVVDESNG